MDKGMALLRLELRQSQRVNESISYEAKVQNQNFYLFFSPQQAENMPVISVIYLAKSAFRFVLQRLFDSLWASLR